MRSCPRARRQLIRTLRDRPSAGAVGNQMGHRYGVPGSLLHAIVNRVGRRARRHDQRTSPANIANLAHLLGIANGEQFHAAPLEHFQSVLDLRGAAHRRRQRHVAGGRRAEGQANIRGGQHWRGGGHARDQPRSRKNARNESDRDGREWHRLTRRTPADCTRAPEAMQGRARNRVTREIAATVRRRRRATRPSCRRPRPRAATEWRALPPRAVRPGASAHWTSVVRCDSAGRRWRGCRCGQCLA